MKYRVDEKERKKKVWRPVLHLICETEIYRSSRQPQQQKHQQRGSHSQQTNQPASQAAIIA